MSEQPIHKIFYMFNGFAKEGIIPHFSQGSIETFNTLYKSDNSVIMIPIKAYIELRDNRTFDQWYATDIEHNGISCMVLCQLYRNRIFEVWAIRQNNSEK
jgi:hypothetical protein